MIRILLSTRLGELRWTQADQEPSETLRVRQVYAPTQSASCTMKLQPVLALNSWTKSARRWTVT